MGLTWEDGDIAGKEDGRVDSLHDWYMHIYN